MVLQDIYDYLSFGEFRQLFLSGKGIDIDNVSAIPRDKFPQILPLVVLGLTEIYKRFQIKEGNTQVPLVHGTSLYSISAPDLLKIERVYGIYLGKKYEIPLNIIGKEDAIRTPSVTSLLIPSDTEEAPWLTETSELDVYYRANHPTIDAEEANCFPPKVSLELPSMYLEPLIYYIASKVLTPRGVSNETNLGNTYTAKFEAAVVQLKILNFEIDDGSESYLLHERGFA